MNVQSILILFCISVSLGCWDPQGRDSPSKTPTLTGEESMEGDIINVIDENNLKQGYWLYTWPNPVNDYGGDVMEEEGFYINDLKNGIWRKYHYESARLESQITYKEGVKHGICKMYHEDGMLKAEGYHKDGGKDGEWTYYDEEGNSVEEFP